MVHYPVVHFLNINIMNQHNTTPKNRRIAKDGFTLIELLTVVAIIAILSAILIPTVGQMRETAVKTADISKLRQISAASLLYATQNREKLVSEEDKVNTEGKVVHDGGESIDDVAAVLAIVAGLNDISAWTSDKDPNPNLPVGAILQVTGTGYSVNSIVDNALSFNYVTNLNMSTPSTAPVAFTKMKSSAASTWDTTDPYDGKGGHIVFMGGNVQWYTDLTDQLVDGNGELVSSIDAAILNLPLGKAPVIRANTTTDAGTGTGTGGT